MFVFEFEKFLDKERQYCKADFKKPEYFTELVDIFIGRNKNQDSEYQYYIIGKDKDGNNYWFLRQKTALDTGYQFGQIKNDIDLGNKYVYLRQGVEYNFITDKDRSRLMQLFNAPRKYKSVSVNSHDGWCAVSEIPKDYIGEILELIKENAPDALKKEV